MRLFRSPLISLLLAVLVLAGYVAVLGSDCGHANSSAVAAESNHYAQDDGADCDCLCHLPVVSERSARPVLADRTLDGEIVFGERADILSDVEPPAIEVPPQLA